MNNEKNGTLDSVVVIIATTLAVNVARYFNMGFWESFFSALLAALVAILIVSVFRNINKKKLYIIMLKNKITNGRHKVTVLLWNPSWIRDVYSSDYGGGLRFVVDYKATIKKLSNPQKIKWANNFSYSEFPYTSENELTLNMGDLKPEAFVEFNFEVHNSGNTLNISLQYGRSNLAIHELKYKKSNQIIHSICRVSVIFILTAMIATAALPGWFNIIIPIGIITLTIAAIISTGLENPIPLRVVKHMKSQGYIDKTKNKIGR